MKQHLENSFRYVEKRSSETNLQTTENLLRDIDNNSLLSSLQNDRQSRQDRQKQQNDALIESGTISDLQLFDSSLSKPGSPDTAADKSEDKSGESPEKSASAENFKSGDQKATLEYDEKGQPKRFTDFNGDTIVREKDGSWTRKNIMGSEKVDLRVDQDGSVKITYRVDKNENDASQGQREVTRTIRRDGSVVTDYPGGVRTTMHRDGDKSMVRVEHNGKGTQTLEYKGAQLVHLTTSDGTKYRLTGKDGKEQWTKTGPDGKVDKFSGHIKPDSDGHVKIYNEDARGTDHYVVRHLGDGTTIQSDETGKIRITRTADGLTIVDRRKEDGTMKRSLTYPDGAGHLDVSFDRHGRAASVRGKIGSRAIDYTTDPADRSGSTRVASIESRKGSDSILITDRDGKVRKVDGKGVESEHRDRLSAPGGRELESQTLVQEVPPGARRLLEERGKFLRHMGMPPLYFAALKMMFDLCKDGGAWDFKQMGGQYQKFGNFAYGFYTGALGMSDAWANRYPGWYKAHQGKSNRDWASTYFQNPADYRTTNAGRRYYDEWRRRGA